MDAGRAGGARACGAVCARHLAERSNQANRHHVTHARCLHTVSCTPHTCTRCTASPASRSMHAVSRHACSVKACMHAGHLDTRGVLGAVAGRATRASAARRHACIPACCPATLAAVGALSASAARLCCCRRLRYCLPRHSTRAAPANRPGSWRPATCCACVRAHMNAAAAAPQQQLRQPHLVHGHDVAQPDPQVLAHDLVDPDLGLLHGFIAQHDADRVLALLALRGPDSSHTADVGGCSCKAPSNSAGPAAP